MLNKTRILLAVLFAVMGLLACSPSMPKGEPDLGIVIDISLLNTTIKVTAPKEINSYKIGRQLELEITNLSDQNLLFSPDEIQIFLAEGDKWQKVPNNIRTIVVDDFLLESNEIGNTKYLILKPTGAFPDDKMPVTVLPDVRLNTAVLLRIFVLAHGQEAENMKPNMTGAYVDVCLVP